jgi:hypothetical protein
MKPGKDHRPASPRSRPFPFMTSSQKPGAHPNASTGPRSAAGKARSSMNALKSGIYSKSLTIPGEDPAKLIALTEEYFQRYCPALPEQRDLVDILVRSTWALRRLAVAEAQVWSHEMDRANKLDEDAPIGHAFCLSDRTLTRLQRMVNSTQRNFRDALRDLERLQALPRDIEPDPVPDPPPVPAAPQPPTQPTETKPVNQSKEFVSSSSTTPHKPVPFHHAGSKCYFDPMWNRHPCLSGQALSPGAFACQQP